jgi:hypothetical protein
MSDTTASRASNGFTPLRFGLLLALLVLAAFPQVLLGLQTFVVRDFGFFSYPAAFFQQQCFRQGELPFWDPYNYCGVPFLAQWNTMPLYPPALVYLLLPLTWSLSFFCLLHLWFAGFGMFLLARRWTDNNFAAAFAGVVFSFNGLTLNLLMWPSHIATLSWMPWVVLVVERAWREGGRRIPLASLVAALQMLAGGPETIFLTWVLLLALWLQQLTEVTSDKRQVTGSGIMSRVTCHVSHLWRFPIIVLLVIALCAIQLLPFLDLVAHSGRHGDYADFRWSMPAWGLANYLVPMAFGDTVNNGVFFQHDQFWTSSYYLGLGALWLALPAAWLVKSRRVRLLAALAVVALIFALGDHTPVYPALHRLVPLLSLITYPVKYVLLVAFLAPLLAAYALAQVQTNLECGEMSPLSKAPICRRIPALFNRLLFIGVLLLALIGVILLSAWRFPFPGDDVHATLLNGLSRVGFLVLTGVLLLALLRPGKSALRRFAPLCLLVVAWLDVLTHEPTQNPTTPPKNYYDLNLARTKLAMNPQPELGGSRAMLTPMAEWQFVHSAIASPQNNFLVGRLALGANCNLLDSLPKVDGFFSLTPRENDDVLSLFYTRTNGDYPGLEDFLGVSQITAPDQIYHWQSRSNFLPLVTAGQKPVFLDDADTLLALARPDFDGSKMVYLPPESQLLVAITNPAIALVTNLRFGLRTVDVEVEASADSLVVVAQTWYHNWRAEVDGRPVPLLRANVAFQAVQVPAGKHRIHFYYRDGVFEIGKVISFVAWAACLVCLVRPARKGAAQNF